MGLNELSELLWHERRLLELLLFTLEQEELLLASGRTQWLGHVTADVESALDRIRRVELARAVEAQEVAVALGSEADAGLVGLAERSPPPWDDILRDHHRDLVDVTDRIRASTRTNRDLLAASRAALQEALTALEDGMSADLRSGAGGDDDDRLRDEVRSG